MNTDAKSQFNLISSRRLLLKIWRSLSRKRHIQILILLVVMLTSGVAELISLGAVVPFLAILSNPKGALDYPIFNSFVTLIGWTDTSNLITPATLLFSIAALLAAFVSC